jgi:hypothetical protein
MSTIPGFVPIGTIPPPVPGLPDQADFHPRLTRTHFFDGRLLTAADLTREQLYLDQRLREVGQALGSGVVRGLGATLAGGRIRIEPGLAITSAGRVLEVRAPLPVDLNNLAALAGLNGGLLRSLPHGLFALVLGYAETPQGVAEVFPRDLTERAGQYDVDREGVQVGLVRLPLPFSRASELGIRAELMRLAAEGALDAIGIPDDAVALGVLAVGANSPQWLDTRLLRHSPRTFPGPGDRQADLKAHYEGLLADVLAARRPLDGDFAARDYFRVLPPTGSLPKAAIDPVGGRQRFFPEHFRVWVAPIRRADLDLVQRESLRLPAIDLGRDEPVDLVVLAPLGDETFGRLAAGLMRNPDLQASALGTADPPVLMPRLDLLALRLHPLPPVHAVGTDRPVWAALWDAVDPDSLVFVRRPTRAAETGISGVRVAVGAPAELAEPETPVEPLPSPADLADLMLDEDALLLRRLDLLKLAALRQPTDDAGRAALADLGAEFGDQAPVVLAVLDLLLLIERRFDPVLWQTLLAAARSDVLAALRDGLVALRAEGAAAESAELMARLGTDLGLDANLLLAWQAL